MGLKLFFFFFFSNSNYYFIHPSLFCLFNYPMLSWLVECVCCGKKTGIIQQKSDDDDDDDDDDPVPISKAPLVFIYLFNLFFFVFLHFIFDVGDIIGVN